jgi:hypothetical protein
VSVGTRWARAGFIVAALAVILLASAIDATARQRHHLRPGCGTRCRNLGGLGAGPPEAAPPRMALLAQRGTLRGTAVAVPLRCLARNPCRGVLLLSANRNTTELGRVDLFVPARATRVIEVTLSAHGACYVRARHRVPGFLTAVYNRAPLDILPLTIFG